MKKTKDKRVFAFVLVLSSLLGLAGVVLVHGCSVSSYDQKSMTSIEITPANATVPVTVTQQFTQQFTATGIYSDGTQTVLSAATWTTSDPTVAAIDSSTGIAQAQNEGTCTITATDSASGLSGATNLTVKSYTFQSLVVSAPSGTIAQGTSLQFTAEGLFTAGTDSLHQDLTSQATWDVSDQNVATVTAGLATGVIPGSVTVTATSGTMTSNPVPLTVTNAILQSISVTGASIMGVKVGSTLQLTATGNFDDGTTQNLTTQVAWSSSDTMIATVDSSGLVTALTPGSVTITATAGSGLGGITGQSTFSVRAAGGH